MAMIPATDRRPDRRPLMVTYGVMPRRPQVRSLGGLRVKPASYSKQRDRRQREMGNAPVSPSAKHREPCTPITEYAHRLPFDRLPDDPWLRVHARAGAVIDSIARPP
jgi:hypothetical protein